MYGEIAVVHFDAHLDTWSGLDLAGALTPTSEVVSPDPTFLIVILLVSSC